MKIALAQINCHIGNFSGNVEIIKKNIDEGIQQGARLIVFPELAVSGYPPLDFLEFNHFTQQCENAIDEIATYSKDIDVIIGAPSINPVAEGKNLYNSAFFLSGGEIKNIMHKSLLPTYDIFDEYRYFEPNKKFDIVESNGYKIALTICEDLWNEEDDPMYVTSPMDELILHQPNLIINIAASPFDYLHEIKRKAILKRNAIKYKLPLAYVNHVGAQTDLLFDGGSLAIDCFGKIKTESKYFEEDLKVIDIEELNTTPEFTTAILSKEEKIHKGLIMGLRDYFSKMGFSKATLGLSGGIDSALVLSLAAEALGPANIFPVMMPSEFSSDHSVDDSITLCKNLGIDVNEISIHSLFNEYLNTLEPQFRNTEFGIAEENIQARIRGTLLMALSNKYGYILLNTSNKSELAVGYGTLYGDMCGGLSVIGDLYKTDVYELAEYLNRDKEIIPKNIITKEPSAELRHGQKDSDSLPDYEEMDEILYQYIEMQQGYDRILKQGFDKDVVKKILKLVNSSEYKRYQFAPVLRVSPKCFGSGRRMPLVAKYLS
jgi:NAD+ synthase (glutamine-hydrolysing)